MSDALEAVPGEADLPNDLNAEPVPPSEMLDLLRRERADFLNYRRRVERERADDRERARQELLQQLLPLLDDLDRAIEQQPPELADHPWAQGVALSHRRLGEALRRLGLERVGAAGEPFDPAVHEAVVYQKQPEDAQQRVVGVLRPGYRLSGQLLRPAQVVVGGPARPAAEQQAPTLDGRRGSRKRSSENG